MRKILLGIVKEDEKESLRTIWELKQGLKNVIKVMNRKSSSIDDVEILLHRAENELAEASIKMNKWWMNISEKYGWQFNDSDRWEISFSSNEIYLIK